MSLGRLLAVRKCVDRRPASGSPFPSGELDLLLGWKTRKAAAAASKSVAGVLVVRGASRTKKGGGKFCFPEASRRKASSGLPPRKRVLIQEKPAQRRVFWGSPWEARVSASECLELGPCLFREKRKLGLRRWLREGLRIFAGGGAGNRRFL